MLASTICSLSGCKDVIEEEIEDKKVILHTPPNNYKSTNSNVSFWWEEVEGATEYRIQIVQPGFNYVEELRVDSLILKNKFNSVLDPGKYQWKIIAQNAGQKIESSIWSFAVDSVKNVTEVNINLLSPSSNLITNQKVINFSWEINSIVEDYRFEIRSPEWMNGDLVFPAQFIETGVFTNTGFPLEDGKYEWGVQGQAGSSNSLYSTRKITVDAIPPGTPILNLPANNSSQNNGAVKFTWNRPGDDGSAVKDSFFIYTDATLNNLARPVQIIENTTYNDSLTAGTYYWRVKSFDEAKNSSEFSTMWNFEITQ